MAQTGVPLDLDGAEEKRAESGDAEGLPRVQVDPEVSGKWGITVYRIAPERRNTEGRAGRRGVGGGVWAIHFRRAEFQVPAGDAEQAEHLGLELR